MEVEFEGRELTGKFQVDVHQGTRDLDAEYVTFVRDTQWYEGQGVIASRRENRTYAFIFRTSPLDTAFHPTMPSLKDVLLCVQDNHYKTFKPYRTLKSNVRKKLIDLALGQLVSAAKQSSDIIPTLSPSSIPFSAYQSVAHKAAGGKA